MADREKLAGWAFWVPLLMAVMLAAWAALPPAPRAAAEPGQYQLKRALADLREITRAPHPTGSAENERVRDVLVARLRAIGVATALQQGTAVRQSPRGPKPVGIAPVSNIVAVLPGRDRSLPAVAVMAHYDSVPFSFGASDDGAGTVAVLETARALVAGPQPQRDVVFLLTDGEEMGLLGAQLFFDDHPLAKRIGMVINAEARGSKGRAQMFQTSPGNAALVDMWADNAIRPAGNSISDAAYRLLPNDTDLSVSLLKGIAGINAAYGAGHFDYHSTTDSFDTIDHGTLQHLGDFTLSTTRALAMAPTLPAAGDDAVFFDTFGLAVVRYPPWLGWVPLVLTALGLAALYRREPGMTLLRGLGGYAGVLAATVALGGLSHAIGLWQLGTGAARMREVMAEIDIMIWIMAALVGAAFLILRPGRAMRLGAVMLMLHLGLAAQIFLPGAAYIFAWPALIGIALLAVEGKNGLAWTLTRIAIAAIVLGLVFDTLANAYVMVGLLSAAVLVLALPFMAAVLPTAPRPGRAAGAALFAGVAIAIGWIATTDGFSQRHPRPGDFFALYTVDDGKAWWATTSDARYLPAGKANKFIYQPFGRRPITLVPATGKPVPPLDTKFTISEQNDAGRRQWNIAIAVPSRLVTIAFKPDQPLTDVRVAGRPVTMKAGEWTQIYYRAPRPITIPVSAVVPQGATVRVRYMVSVPGLPQQPPRDAGLVTNWTQFSGSEMFMGEWQAPR